MPSQFILKTTWTFQLLLYLKIKHKEIGINSLLINIGVDVYQSETLIQGIFYITLHVLHLSLMKEQNSVRSEEIYTRSYTYLHVFSDYFTKRGIRLALFISENMERCEKGTVKPKCQNTSFILYPER